MLKSHAYPALVHSCVACMSCLMVPHCCAPQLGFVGRSLNENGECGASSQLQNKQTVQQAKENRYFELVDGNSQLVEVGSGDNWKRMFF